MTPNRCHSKPRPAPHTTITVQDGYYEPPVDIEVGQYHTRQPRYVLVPHVMTCACVYGPMNNDPRCGAFPELGLAPCPHKEKK